MKRISACILTLVACFFFQTACAQDNSPPILVSFDFNPKAIDTADSPSELTAIAHLTDDISGFFFLYAIFYSPSQGQAAALSMHLQHRVSGSAKDGVYQNNITIPQYSEHGTWKLNFIYIEDLVGNRKQLTRDDAAAMGFPTEFQVTSTGDTSPPSLVSFDFTPKAINTADSPAELSAVAHLIDDMSGFSYLYAIFYSPSQEQTAYLYIFSHNRISGSAKDGVYQNNITIPQYSENGTWKLSDIYINDLVGNTKQLTRDDAAAMGFPTEFRNGPISGELSISGMKFNDLNSNGVKDSGESGVPDWSIELLQGSNTIETIATGSDGSYSFNYLGARTYTIREVPQAGWTQTYPSGNSHNVVLSKKSSLDNDFGNHQLVDSDIIPPNLIAFDFNPKTVNTAVSSQQILFSARITDDLSGFSCIYSSCSIGNAYFLSPSGLQSASVSFSSDDFVSGNDLDGVYASQLILPRYSERGTWTLQSFYIEDRVGNPKIFSKGEMDALGFPNEFQVESQGDTSPPSLVSFDFNPKVVNTATSSQLISFSARITDDLSGFGCIHSICSIGHAYFRSPSGLQSASVSFSSRDLVSGNDMDGVYASQLTLPKYSEQGTWTLQSFYIEDRVGNEKSFSKEELEALGFPTKLINGQETEPIALKIAKYTNGEDADSPTGPWIPVGGNVTWKYIVTTASNFPLHDVKVTDSIAGVKPVRISGDNNSDGLLTSDETWIYEATGIAVAGQYANIGKVWGKTPGNQLITSEDPSHYFGGPGCDISF